MALRPAPTDSTPPTAGTVTVTPSTATYVPPAFTITTQFTDAESAVNSCQYTLNDGGAWAAGTVSGAGPYTCSANVAGQANGAALAINMRATSTGGTGTATKIDRTVDAAGPTDGTLSASPGNTQVVLNWTAATDSASGLHGGGTTYKVVRGAAGAAAPANCSTGTVVTAGTDLLTATATGLVNGSTYGFRVCAYDAFDNLSAGTTASATPTACTDATVGTIAIPAGQTVSGSSVDLTALYTVGGTPNFSGFTYKINGSTVTSPWNSSAFGTSGPESVTFEVTGSDPDCGGTTVVASGTISVNNFVGTTAGTATATAADKSIVVSAPYSGDLNGNNSVKVEWGLNGVDFTLGSVTLPHAVSPYAYTIPNLTNGTAYQVRVTYQETVPDTVSGAAVQTFTAITPMNFMMHNSLTTGSTKWPLPNGDSTAAGWGIAGSKYGEFVCATCHVKNATPNIKRVKQTITAPDATPSNFPGSAATVLFTTTDEVANPAESGFGDDNPPAGRTMSDKVCEVCHSITSYHRYNTSADPDGAGPLTAQTNLTHYNNQDCVSCHQHKQGFKASCDSCHGNPPVDAGTLVDTPGITNSTEFGAHAGHVVDAAGPQYTCGVCHGIPFGSGANHTTVLADMKVTIDFNAFGTTGASVAGTYKGQIGVVYDGDNDAASNDSLDCSSVYCHGGTIGGGTPKWNDVSAPCGSCHGATAASPPANPASSLSHQTHAGTGGGVDAQNSTTLTGTVMACSACHGANGAGPGNHVDGKTQFNVTALTRDYRAGTGPFYNGAASGDSGVLAPSNPYKTCTNLECHWGTATPAWNSGPANCGTCHPASPTSGKHADHTTASATYVTCDNCHGTGAKTGTHAGHINGAVNFYGTVSAADNNLDATDFSGEATRGNTTDDTCAVVCHKDGDWGDGTVATTSSAPANQGTIDWTLNCSSVPVVDFCLDCHSDAYSAKAGPTVVTRWLNNGAAGLPTGSHLKATTAETLPGEDLTCTGNDVADWKAQCQKCHTKHSGTVQIPLPPTSWDNPGTAAVETTNMRTQLGISYAGADHGAIKLGGTSTSGSTEADVCWNCHGTNETVNEWGYNQDTNGASFPVVTIADRNTGTAGSHNYGYIYTTSARTVKASAWVDASGNGYWHQDGYSTATQLQRRITSVHSVNFTPANQVSSVGTAVNASTGVLTATPQETPANIRCTYCHDVHDLNLGVSDTNTGRPFLRGSWVGNPYPPDMPPLDAYSYVTTGGPTQDGVQIGNRFRDQRNNINMPIGLPRLFPSISVDKGGYFIDQNSNWPTKNASYDTLAETAGVCTVCHGTDVDNMDFYPNAVAATKMWRPGQVNGHANSALGGTGVGHANSKNLFDARRGATSGVFMAVQDAVPGVNQYGKSTYNGLDPQQDGAFAPDNGGPFDQAADGSATGVPPTNTGFYGGTEGTRTRGGQYATWYSATGVGTDGSTGATRAHSFTCSKCHTPHASGLPALLITNCLDTQAGTWDAGPTLTEGIGPKATSTWGRRVANNCHRKETWGTAAANRDTGWHYLAPGQ